MSLSDGWSPSRGLSTDTNRPAVEGRTGDVRCATAPNAQSDGVVADLGPLACEGTPKFGSVRNRPGWSQFLGQQPERFGFERWKVIARVTQAYRLPALRLRRARDR